jgi:hypothetical protein
MSKAGKLKIVLTEEEQTWINKYLDRKLYKKHSDYEEAVRVHLFVFRKGIEFGIKR